MGGGWEQLRQREWGRGEAQLHQHEVNSSRRKSAHFVRNESLSHYYNNIDGDYIIFRENHDYLKQYHF